MRYYIELREDVATYTIGDGAFQDFCQEYSNA